MKSKYVLVVDDQEINRTLLCEAFKGSYGLLEAENGEKAMTLLKEYRGEVALILLDLLMPVKDGFDVLDFIKKEGMDVETPVFIVTSDDTAEAQNRLSHYMVADIITKPFLPRIIKRRAENIIKVYEITNERIAQITFEMDKLLVENENLKDKCKDYEKRWKAITKNLGLA